MIMHSNNLELICGLILLLSIICVSFQYSLAQTTPECDTQSTPAPQDDTQTSPETSDLLPDVTSDICLIMTPDLPDNLSTDILQNPVDQGLQSINETVQTTLDNDTTASNLGTIPENVTVMNPSPDIPSQSVSENVARAIQDELDNNTGFILNDQDKISNSNTNTNSSINTTSISNQNISSQSAPINETLDLTVPSEPILGSNNTTNISNGAENQIPSLDTTSNPTNSLDVNLSKIAWKNFTSEGGYSLAYPQNWNLTVHGNETHITSDKLNSDYFPLLSIFIQKVDPIALNNTQALAQMLPIENISNEIINAILNNSKLQSNILLKYYIDLEYDVLEPTQTGKYIIDEKQASSFKVHKSDDNYEREFIIVNNNGKIYNIEINHDSFLSFDENDMEIEDLKQQIINSIQWVNETNQNVDVQEIKVQKIERNDNETDSNEIKSTISSSEADLNMTSSTHFFDNENFKIVGEVINNGSDKRELVKVVITLYDDNNNVIGTELSYTNPSDIFSKQTAPFEIIISQGDVRNTSAIKSYKLFLTSDVETSSNTNEQLSQHNTDAAATSDSSSSEVQSSVVSNATSQNPLDMLKNLFKDTNSTISSDALSSNFTMNKPAVSMYPDPIQLTENIVESSIVPGASLLGDTAYSPNPLSIDVGQTIRWTNDDTAFHTVTSGIAGSADVGKVFDSGLAGPTAMTSKGKTFEHTFDASGEYPFFCTLHPFMVGKIMVG